MNKGKSKHNLISCLKKKRSLKIRLKKLYIRLLILIVTILTNTSFDKNVLVCLERIFDFADTVKKIHDISKYPLDPCDVGSFADELYIHVHSERRSPRLMNFFLSLCKRYPQGFINLCSFYHSNRCEKDNDCVN